MKNAAGEGSLVLARRDTNFCSRYSLLAFRLPGDENDKNPVVDT